MSGRTLEHKAVWTCRFAALAATVEAFFLFIFGLDLTTEQSWLFFFFGLPAVFIMYGVDRWLIRCYVSPIQPALDALAAGQILELPLAYQAWVQALNLPTLTLLRVLNVFFTEVVAAVEAEGGIVKQFTGDGVMALFGAPVSHLDDPARAVRAALGLLDRLEGLNARLHAQHAPPLRVGVGIHTGEVVAGRIGPDTRVEYGVVGDPVNLASRIERLTKELQATILVSKTTADRLGAGFIFGRTAVLPVKGKQQPVEVVEVVGNGNPQRGREGRYVEYVAR